MEQTVASDTASATAKAQRLRLNRILGGAASYALTAAIVTVSWGFGYLDGERVVHFVIAVVAINVLAVGLVLGNWNLRLARSEHDRTPRCSAGRGPLQAGE